MFEINSTAGEFVIQPYNTIIANTNLVGIIFTF